MGNSAQGLGGGKHSVFFSDPDECFRGSGMTREEGKGESDEGKASKEGESGR